MSDAIARMCIYLAQAEPWKPDRYGVQREKICSRCRKKKVLSKFAFAGSRCQDCDKIIRKQWVKNGRARYA